MKTVCNKLLSLILVAVLLVSAVPFQAFASENETIPVSVQVYINGEPVSTKTLNVPVAGVALNESTAMSLLDNTTGRSFANWTNNSGEDVTGKTLSNNDWLNSQNGYSLNLYLTESIPTEPTETEPTTTETEPTTTETEPTTPPVVEPTEYLVTYSVKVLNNAERVFSRKYEEGTQITLNYGLIGEDASSFGTSPTETWRVNGTEKAHGSTITVNSNLAITFTVYNTETATISLHANGGSVSPYSMNVVLGQAYPKLPTPTRSGYTFQHWYRMNGNVEEKITATTTATNAPLYAKWVANGVSVTFQRYTDNGWQDVRVVPVTAGSTVGQPSDSFAYSCDGVNFEIIGWEIGDTDTEFKFNSTKVNSAIVVRPRYRGTVTLKAENPTATVSFSTKTITVEIGEPIPALPNPGARDGYAFADWAYVNGNGEYVSIATDATLSNVSAHPNYYPSMGTTFYARWANSQVIYLYIHTQGNYQTATKIIPYYNASATGALNLKYIDLYTLWPSFKNFDDNGDTSFGWYSRSQWKNFCAGIAADEMEDVVYDVGSNSDYWELHIMLYDNTNGDSSNGNSSNNNYNNNSNTADKSNPTTGDMIMIAVTVMAISAAALAMIFFMKKRKASK